MTPLPSSKPSRASCVADGLRGLLLGCLLLGLGSCGKPETENAEQDIPEQGADTASPSRAPAGKKPESRAHQRKGAEVRFLSYNVENWLTMERYENRKPVGNTPKPEKEKSQVIRILSENKPDILGLCEVGTKDDLREIQRLLEKKGISLPHLHHSTGGDPVRSLGLLSRHPIVSTNTSAPIEYRLQGKTFEMSRGILDATVDADGLKLRFLGVHLKSKREIPDGDQEVMRVNEARLLRRHVDSLFASEPKARLVVYGDFNDSYPSATVRTITSHPNPEFRLRPVYLRDSRGEAWTHHWGMHDIYSRIDFITTSDTLRDRVEYKASRIIDDPAWDQASDHRPLLVVFR